MMACLAPAVMKSALKKRKRSSAEGSEHAPGAVGVGFKTPSTDKKVRIGDGKSCEKAVGSADPDVDRTPIELPFHCDNCGHYILTTRYNCGKCADYDLCEACFGARQNDKKMCPHKHHASHFVVAAVDELFHDERGDVPPALTSLLHVHIGLTVGEEPAAPDLLGVRCERRQRQLEKLLAQQRGRRRRRRRRRLFRCRRGRSRLRRSSGSSDNAGVA